jgi:Zn-dependent protease
MNSSLRLFRIFGIDVQLHFTWWFVFGLLSWSLSSSFFPQFFPGYEIKTYWIMGILAALLLFISVLLHELAHSLVAKAQKISVKTITLFFFGGVAGITDEDIPPKSELLMALAGPIFSLVLSGIFYLLNVSNLSIVLTAISFYLFQLNLMLALFNLIPGFPLDGGRALRAVVYWITNDLRKATKIAVTGGKIFAGVLVFLGVLQLVLQMGSGLWLVLLGGFLFMIAGASYEQVMVKEALKNVKIGELLHKKITILNTNLTFAQFSKKYSNSEEELFLVKDKGFYGILDTRKIDKMSKEVQEKILLKQVAIPISALKAVNFDDNVYVGYKEMAVQDVNILPVTKNGKVVGFVTRNGIMHRLIWSLKYGVNGGK